MNTAHTVDQTNRDQLHWVFWPVLLGAVLLSTAVPWYLGLLDVDIQLVLWGLLGCAVLSSLFLEWQFSHSAPGSVLVRGVPYLLGVALLTGVWLKLGSLDVPSFLILYCVPVVAAALSSQGWLEWLVAGCALACVSVAALASNPALYWYLDRMALLPAALKQSLLGGLAQQSASLSGDPGRDVLIILSFAVCMIATALLGSTIGNLVRSLSQRLANALDESTEIKAFANTLLEQSETPIVVVTPHHGEMLRFNAAFSELLGCEPAADKPIFDLVTPIYPEQLQACLDGDRAGTVPRVACRIDGRYALLDLDFSIADKMSKPVVQIRLMSSPAGDLAVQALDEFAEGLIILDPDGSVLFCNQLAQDLFPACSAGAKASNVLGAEHGLEAGWWNLMMGGAAELSAEHGGALYRVAATCASAKAGAALTYIRISPRSSHEG